MSLTPSDAELLRTYIAGELSFEDALRRAQSVAELRRAIQLYEDSRWKDDGEDGAVDELCKPPNPRPSVDSYAKVKPGNV